MASEHQARGSFAVTMTPETSLEAAGLTSARVTVAKVFSGGLEGQSTGTMLTGITPESGSAAYVLLERVEGRLDGSAGSFALAHLGLMDKGSQQQRVAIVPGSGTGALLGVRGEMTLDVGAGRHDYVLNYSMDAK